MKDFFNWLLSFLYPDKCIFCQEIIKRQKEDKFICDYCHESLPTYEEEIKEEEKIATVFQYKGVVKEMLHRFKFRFHPEYAKPLAEIMANRFNTLSLGSFDYVVAVPMHLKKQKRRGYNQAWLLAKELSLIIKTTAVENQLVRVKKTKAQSGLNHTQRAENVKNAFLVREKGFFEDKRVLLVDDIYTTGSTAKGCREVLMEAGAKEVYVFTLSKTVKK